jgi:hypothetical protein
VAKTGKCTPYDRGLCDTSDVSAKFLRPADCSRIAKMVVTENPKPVKDDAVTKNCYCRGLRRGEVGF